MNPLGLLLAASMLFGGDAQAKTKAPPSKGWPKPPKPKAKPKAKPPKPKAAKPKAKPAAKPPKVKLPDAAVTNALAKAIPALRALSKTQPQPWPSVAPSTLPPFPGPGWTPDTPVRPEVAARAAQLIRPLHARGVGAHVIEQTGGRWIAYVARMHGTKKAVEAYRRTSDAPVAPRPPVPGAPAPRPPVPSPTPAIVRPSPVVAPTPAPSMVLPPTIRRGDGNIRGGARRSLAPHVERAQRELNARMESGEPLVVDGAFGAKTEAAVKQWQTHKGLQVNGIVGPETWPTLIA